MKRVEPHTIGSIMHVIKRGTRGMNIVRDEDDKIRFVRSLFYLNDTYQNENWKRDIAQTGMFERPAHWPDREPLVNILAWTLTPNHFHLLVQERVEGGIGKFMQRLGNSTSKSFNEKYKEKGSLFQGSYKGRIVGKDVYLRQLVWYILIKNTLELYPGGIPAALKNFDRAWRWGLGCRYSSFGDSVKGADSPVTTDVDGLIGNICRATNFKKISKELLTLRKFRSEELKKTALEPWA